MTASKTFTNIFVATMLILTFIFVGLSWENTPVDWYTSTNEVTDNAFPPWGSVDNPNLTVDDGDLTVASGADTGTYIYTSPVEAGIGRFVSVESFRYSTDLKDGEIKLIIYSSDNNFTSIKDSETFQLDEGTGRQTTTLLKGDSYRYQVIFNNVQNSKPELESLDIKENNIIIAQDYSEPFYIGMMLLFLAVIFFVLVQALADI